MTLTENFIHNAILIDPEAEIVYSSDQINDTYPYRFPTVEFMLTATKTLVEMADRIRLEKGYLPMYPIDGRNGEVDHDGWYDFYIGISKFLGNNQQGCVDNCINFMCCCFVARFYRELTFVAGKGFLQINIISAKQKIYSRE